MNYKSVTLSIFLTLFSIKPSFAKDQEVSKQCQKKINEFSKLFILASQVDGSSLKNEKLDLKIKKVAIIDEHAKNPEYGRNSKRWRQEAYYKVDFNFPNIPLDDSLGVIYLKGYETNDPTGVDSNSNFSCSITSAFSEIDFKEQIQEVEQEIKKVKSELTSCKSEKDGILESIGKILKHQNLSVNNSSRKEVSDKQERTNEKGLRRKTNVIIE